MYPWFVFLHVLGVFGFLMAHGVSVAVAFSLRRERNPERIRTLLNLSGSSIGFLNISIVILLLTGIVAGFIGGWWSQGWIWLSLGLLIAISVYMGVAASGHYGQVRKAVELASSEGIDALLNRSRPLQLAVAGFGSLAVIAWLMMFKPF